jgi:hypothetical protein
MTYVNVMTREEYDQKNACRADVLDDVIANINDFLRTENLTETLWGSGDTKGYWMTRRGSLNVQEKLEIKRIMKNAGWDVKVKNSEDEDRGRPGLYVVIFSLDNE